MRHILLFGVIALSACFSAASAEEWSLERCINHAMEHNLQLKQKRVAVMQSQTDAEAKKGALLPTVSFQTGQNVSWRPWSKSFTNITDGTMNTTNSVTNYNGNYGVAANWNVWNGGRNRKQVDRSELSLRQAEVDENSTRLSLQEQIVQLYVQILYQKEAVEVNKQVLESTRTLCARAQQMYEVGQMSRADYAQMQAQVSQEEYNVSNAITQLRSTTLSLSQILQLPLSDDFTVAIPSISEEGITASCPVLKNLYSMAGLEMLKFVDRTGAVG